MFVAAAMQLNCPAIAIDTQNFKSSELVQKISVKDVIAQPSPQASTLKLSDPTKLPAVQWALFGTQVVTLLALIITVWKTWEMAVATQKAANATAATVEEMRKARESASAPHIVVYLASPGSNIAEIIVENFGEGTARDIQLKIEPPLQSSLSKDIGRFFETPKWLPPRSRLSHALDVWSTYFASDYPRRYTVKVDYVGVNDGKQYSDEYVLDIDSFRHMAAWGKKDLGDLVKTIDKFVNEYGNQGRRREKHYGIIEAGFPYSENTNSYNEAIARIRAIHEALEGSKSDGLIHFPTRPLLHGLRLATLSAITHLDKSKEENANLRLSLVDLFILLHNARLWNDMADDELSLRIDQTIEKVLSFHQDDLPSV
ncbi:MAG: hypothetical protein ACK5FE_07040 [Cyanobacteriota bacterium]